MRWRGSPDRSLRSLTTSTSRSTPPSRPASETSSTSTPLAILQPRTALAWQIAPKTVLRTGFGLFSDLLPGSVADLVGVNPPYSQTFQGGLLGTVGGTAIAPGVPGSAIDATVAANQTFNAGFASGQLSCASPLVQSEYLPAAGGHHRRARRQAARALFHGVELRARTPDRQHDQSARAVCRHARREPALHDPGERLSDGVPGLLRSVPLWRSRPIRDSAP